MLCVCCLWQAFTLVTCIGSFIYAIWINDWILAKDDSNPQMRVISEAIKEGAEGMLFPNCNYRLCLRSDTVGSRSCFDHHAVLTSIYWTCG